MVQVKILMEYMPLSHYGFNLFSNMLYFSVLSDAIICHTYRYE